MRATCLIACGLLFVASPHTASAQIGGLIRKAKDAATTKTDNKDVKSSAAFGPELTQASLDAVIRGLAAAQPKLVQIDQLRAERQKIDSAWAKSSTAHDKDREAYARIREKSKACQDSVMRVRSQAAQAAYMKKMQADPTAAAKMAQAAMEVSQKSAALQAKGDTAGMRRLVMDMAKAQGIDPQGDSTFAAKTCGELVPKPAWLIEQEAMRERSTKIDAQVRDLETGAQNAAVSASGMSPKDYSVARERVLHWSIEARGGRAIQGFGSDERKLLEARQSDIEKYRRALN
jgi:hypothetical protein